MKNKFLFACFLLFATIAFSQSYHDTQGKLEISESGQSVYTLPIALPASIQSVGPTINLSYSSGQDGGIAGQGWNISGISVVSRIATRKDIDGFIDGVDFDNNDKLALDGQRLLLKTGIYWGEGSTYETEVQSNLKIELTGSGESTTIIVTSPDGSITWYGTSQSRAAGVVANELDSFFYIKKFVDVSGNVIEYRYKTYATQGGQPKIYIDEILFSYNSQSNTSYLNSVKFNYESAARIESAYVKGIKSEKTHILKSIAVYTAGNLFRKYDITHTTDNLGYQRVQKITEFNGANEAANPVNFEYHSTTSGQVMVQEDGLQPYLINPDGKTYGDPDGDGKPNFVFSNKITNVNGLPVTLPFYADTRRTHFVRTLQNNKLQEKPKLLNIVENLNSLEVKLYNVEGLTQGSINNYSSKVIPFDNTTTYVPGFDSTTNVFGHCSSGCGDYCGSLPTIKMNQYIQGDFNGDGISEILMFSKKNEKHYKETKIYDVPSPVYHLETCNLKFIGDEVESYMIDLNPSIPAVEGTQGFVKITNMPILQNEDKKFVQDFNGDGKDDVLIINSDNTYKVVVFNQLTASPWISCEVIGQGVLDFSANEERIILFGDYNGDGKTDIMLPIVVGVGCEDESFCDIWNLYYSNPKLNAGSFFETDSQHITDYMPLREYSTQAFYNRYLSMDVNKDGISDLVRIEMRTYEHTGFFDFNSLDNGRNSFRIHTFVKTPTGFVNDFTSVFHDDGTENGNVAIPVNMNVNRNFITQDLVLFRKGHDVNGTDSTFYIKFTKDHGSDNALKKVTESDGSIVNEIEYKNFGKNAEDPNFYIKTTSAVYPFVDIKEIPNAKLVSRLKNTVNGINARFQFFNYYGYVVNLDGSGAIGFTRTGKTNLSEQYGFKIWNVSENDILLRGAALKNWSRRYEHSEVFNISQPFSVLPGTISSSVNTYFPALTNPVTKLYTLLLQTQKNADYLTNVTNEKTYGYSSDGYNLPETIVSKNFLGTTLQGTSTTSTTFLNATGTGSGYYIGRPKEIINTVNAYGDTKSSSEKFSYTNGNVTQKEKTVGTTAASLSGATEKLIETMTYFPNGNLQTKTISATGFPATTPPLTSRTTSYTYDTTNRFVKTITDPDGIVNTNDLYHPLYGLVEKQTNNTFGQSSTSIYDNWGKRTKITDLLGKSTNLTYTKYNAIRIVNETGDDGSMSSVDTDVLGRVIRKGTLTMDNGWSFVSFEYDIFGRKVLESEPYFSGSPIWSITSYDDYDRPVFTISKGKHTTITYDGLSATITDGITTRITTKNANGHVISTEDTQGGLISYAYDALGNVLTTTYDGIVNSTIQYDLWGRKTSMNDVSAGIHTYTYNAYGEILNETSPNGLTDYTYTSSGKPLTKWVKDAPTPVNTDIKTTYNYDATYKWLNSMTVLNPIDGNSTFTYTYDNVTKQLKKTVEASTDATFTKECTFDAFGRVETETLSALVLGKTSTRTTLRTYLKGQLYKIYNGTAATGVPIWRANGENAREQLTSILLGNGINITNTYHNFGYLLSSTHSNYAQTVMNFNNTFDADATLGGNPPFTITYSSATGNLFSKSNNITSNGNPFGVTEDFTYDALDRLTSSKSNDLVLLEDLTFTSSEEGFIAFDSPIPYPNLGSGTATQLLNNGKLEVTVTGTAGTKKTLFQSGIQGQSFKVEAATSFIYGNGNCLFGNSPTISISIKEIDTDTQQELLSTVLYSQNDYVYTIVNAGAEIVLEIGSSSFLCGDYVIFAIDALKIFKQNLSYQNYDNKGRITANNLGSYNYTKNANPYQNTSVTLNYDGLLYYDTRSRLDITYNGFRSPIHIVETGIERISFGYNAMEKRSVMYYGNYESNKLLRPYRKYYSADGSMEVKYTLANNGNAEVFEFFTYIGGDAYTAPIVSRQIDTATPAYYYLHRDYQGSILAITNETGDVVEKRRFDVWGEIVEVRDGNNNILSKLTFFDRGYTGHEHLQGVALIHMNARLYDPKVHRFLQPDNLITDPSNGQNYNRYAYCVNNPTKYIDPDGNSLVAVGVGVAVALVSYFATSAINHQNVNFVGILKTAFIACVSSVATFGVGNLTESITPLALRFAVQAVAHGGIQGGFTAVQGGKFWNGFASGSISSLVSSSWTGGNNAGEWQGVGGKFADSTVGIVGFGTVSGGAAAELTGGNFWQGALSGFTVSALNHAYHLKQIKNEIESKYPRLYKTLSNLRSFLKSNPDVLEAFTETSGYSRKEALRLLTATKISAMLDVEEQDNWGHFPRSTDPTRISIRKSLIDGLEKVNLPQNLKLTSFFTAVVVLHEMVHFGRYWNGLSSKIGIYEAGQVFETNAFGRIIELNGNDQIVKNNGWKF